MNFKGFGRKQLWPDLIILPALTFLMMLFDHASMGGRVGRA
jgi:hypothetical protein